MPPAERILTEDGCRTGHDQRTVPKNERRKEDLAGHQVGHYEGADNRDEEAGPLRVPRIREAQVELQRIVAPAELQRLIVALFLTLRANGI